MFGDGQRLGLRAAATTSRANRLGSDPSGPSLRRCYPARRRAAGPLRDPITPPQGPHYERLLGHCPPRAGSEAKLHYFRSLPQGQVLHTPAPGPDCAFRAPRTAGWRSSRSKRPGRTGTSPRVARAGSPTCRRRPGRARPAPSRGPGGAALSPSPPTRTSFSRHCLTARHPHTCPPPVGGAAPDSARHIPGRRPLQESAAAGASSVTAYRQRRILMRCKPSLRGTGSMLTRPGRHRPCADTKSAQPGPALQYQPECADSASPGPEKAFSSFYCQCLGRAGAAESVDCQGQGLGLTRSRAAPASGLYCH